MEGRSSEHLLTTIKRTPLVHQLRLMDLPGATSIF